jgi:hypothetical protein
MEPKNKRSDSLSGLEILSFLTESFLLLNAIRHQDKHVFDTKGFKSETIYTNILFLKKTKNDNIAFTFN